MHSVERERLSRGSLTCVGRSKGLIGMHVKNAAARSCFAQSGSRILLIRSQDMCCYNWVPSGACRLVIASPRRRVRRCQAVHCRVLFWFWGRRLTV